ncbi:hypothetical protein BKP37_00480 [Anaerobacillus alkalilacustris]|uniref:Uncharacterized protein n=1 Tax=Anaerobacillus alkalilacustris TaxID=393763 RepID=A0A1S2LXU8_9BACI|nr:hypothetical protein [Anaerobacillus alkalilacustris]OIJ17050.1 hypothetical protein BKP37_00480 [Anaerobacillus alkalilacustris]
MKTFRTKICNPVIAVRVYKCLSACTYQELRTSAGSYAVVDRLAQCCEVTITPETRDYVARWLMNCGVDPRNPHHRRSMWSFVNS